MHTNRVKLKSSPHAQQLNNSWLDLALVSLSHLPKQWIKQNFFMQTSGLSCPLGVQKHNRTLFANEIQSCTYDITFSNICSKEVIVVNILFDHLFELNYKLGFKERQKSAQLCQHHLSDSTVLYPHYHITHADMQMSAKALLDMQME